MGKSQPSQKPKPKVINLKDRISPEDLAKIQASTEGGMPVDEEWLLLTEFALKFGWEAYLDVKADVISGAEMKTLIEASRRLEYLNLYRDSTASFIGAISAQQKKPSTTFNRLTKDMIKKAKSN